MLKVALIAAAFVCGFGWLLAFVLVNALSVALELFYPLPHPLDEGLEQAARYESIELFGYAAFAIGMMIGLALYRRYGGYFRFT